MLVLLVLWCFSEFEFRCVITMCERELDDSVRSPPATAVAFPHRVWHVSTMLLQHGERVCALGPEMLCTWSYEFAVRVLGEQLLV